MHHIFIFAAIVVFSWLAISNLLLKFSMDVAMASKFQTEFIIRKFGKNSSHMHCIFNIFVSAGGFKTMISVMLLKFTMEVAKLAMATKLTFNSQNCTNSPITSVICTVAYLQICCCCSGFLWLPISNMLLRFSRDVAVATKSMQKIFQFNIVRAVQSKLWNSKIILGLTLIARLYPYLECTMA